MDDLFSLVERYSAVIESQCESASCDKVFEGIRKAREDLDIDYLAEEAPRAAKQTIAGVKQVQKIVSSMKKISHPGNDRIELADINEIIEEAITISTNEWRYVADIEVDLDKSITSIPCFSGELSQVFLNLIVNAAHAIDEAKLGLEKGTIKVSSNPLQSGVEVRIEDDGTGIPEEIRDKVFDPFFTTKEVGKGTGQGLSIVYGIVENHNGSIRIESELGLGTTFVVNLPISQEVEIESA